MMLKPIKPRETAHQACEQALRRAVLTGELGAGDRLPPERELATTLGVSRLTLRAALAALTAQGLLTVRHGRGYVIQDFLRVGGADLLGDVAELAVERGELAPVAAELLRVRRHLARAILEHLAEQPPKVAAIRVFDAAVVAMAAVVAATEDRAVIAAADLAVVGALVDATGSPVLRLCLNPIVAVVANAPRLRDALYADPATNVAGWRVLGSWLTRPTRDLDRLVAVLAQHDAASLARLSRRPRSS